MKITIELDLSDNGAEAEEELDGWLSMICDDDLAAAARFGLVIAILTDPSRFAQAIVATAQRIADDLVEAERHDEAEQRMREQIRAVSERPAL